MGLIDAILRDSPAAYYPMDDASSPLKNYGSWGSAANMDFGGAVGTYRNGKLVDTDVLYGNTMAAAKTTFSGTTTGSYTIEGWFRWKVGVSPVTGWALLGNWTSNAGTMLYSYSTTQFSAYVNGLYSVFTFGSIAADVWYHVAATWNQASGTTRLFRNGIQVGSDQVLAAGATISQPSRYSLGYYNYNGGTAVFNGHFGHLAWFATDLAPWQIRNHYDGVMRHGVFVG